MFKHLVVLDFSLLLLSVIIALQLSYAYVLVRFRGKDIITMGIA